jgi:hypothetical protein
MLWTIAAILITLWWLGMMTGYTMGVFIDVLITAAIVLLVISINQEAAIYQNLKQELKKSSPTRSYRKANTGKIGL